MKLILYILTPLLFLLASCQQEDNLPSSETGKGYLSLSSIEIEASTITPISTRAVSPELAIEIIKPDGTSVIAFEAGAAQASGKIELQAGEYKLKAYSPNYGSTLQDDELGAPIYYKEQNFTIVEEKINYLSVQVPMTNIGVQFMLPEGFNNWFIDYAFSAQIGNRKVTLQEGETAYFDLPESSNNKLQYSLSATNSDNEFMQQDNNFEGTLTPGTVYGVTYSIATQSLLSTTPY